MERTEERDVKQELVEGTGEQGNRGTGEHGNRGTWEQGNS